MNNESLHNYPVWDRLFELLFPCDENLTDAEVDAEIARLGIDMTPAFRRLHKMIEAQRAKAHFANAKERRIAIAEQIRDIAAPRLDDLRRQVGDFLEKMKSDKAQLAYFHKLERAASEEDLQSLLDDIEKLEALKELKDDSQGE
jgi:hypothetical protein